MNDRGEAVGSLSAQEIGLRALLAADFALGHPRPGSFRMIWIWRFVIAVLVVGFNLAAMTIPSDYIDRDQMRVFFLSSLPYAAASLLGCCFHLLCRGQRPRAEWGVSLVVVVFEAIQVGLSLSYVGMSQAVSIGYMLVMIIVYTVFVDAIHGLLAFLGNALGLCLVYSSTTAGWIMEGACTRLETGPWRSPRCRFSSKP